MRCQYVYKSPSCYENVKYINSHTKVNITCPVHGDFEQFPFQHIRGCGCPKCNSSKIENELEKYFTENDIKYISQYKSDEYPFSCDFYFPTIIYSKYIT